MARGWAGAPSLFFCPVSAFIAVSFRLAVNAFAFPDQCSSVVRFAFCAKLLTRVESAVNTGFLIRTINIFNFQTGQTQGKM